MLDVVNPSASVAVSTSAAAEAAAAAVVVVVAAVAVGSGVTAVSTALLLLVRLDLRDAGAERLTMAPAVTPTWLARSLRMSSYIKQGLLAAAISNNKELTG